MTALLIVLAVCQFLFAALYAGCAGAEALRIRPADTVSVVVGAVFSLIALASGVALVACALS